MPPQAQAAKHDLSNWLREAVENANLEVFNLRKSAGTDMGSTMVAAAVVGNQPLSLTSEIAGYTW